LIATQVRRCTGRIANPSAGPILPTSTSAVAGISNFNVPTHDGPPPQAFPRASMAVRCAVKWNTSGARPLSEQWHRTLGEEVLRGTCHVIRANPYCPDGAVVKTSGGGICFSQAHAHSSRTRQRHRTESSPWLPKQRLRGRRCSFAGYLVSIAPPSFCAESMRVRMLQNGGKRRTTQARSRAPVLSDGRQRQLYRTLGRP